MSSTLPIPKTPSRKTKPELFDTPNSTGPGSDSAFKTRHTRPDYKGYLEADLQVKCIIEFDKFLEIAFAFQPTQEMNDHFNAITLSGDFQQLLEDYKEETAQEEDRYLPFNILANHIINELAQKFPFPPEQEPIVFCRNDNVKVEGSFAARIPDCVVVSEKASQQDRVGWENMSKGPKGEPFFWSDLLAFVEFKVNVKKAAESSASESKQSDALSTSEVISSGVAPAVASTSSAIASTSSSTSLTVDLPPRFSTSGNSESSQKRPGEDLQETPKKRRKGDKVPPKEVRVQCASYALEMLSHGGLRTHVISALVTNTELVLLFYDRSLPVMSKLVDFSKEPVSLVAFIYCLRRATPSQWGRVSRITLGLDPLSTPDTHQPLAVSSPPLLSTSQGEPDEPQTFKPHPLRGAILTLNDGTKLLLTELVFVQHALIGRGTCVVRAKVIGHSLKDWKGKSLVVKFSFTPKTRVPEGDILAEILSIANGHSKMNAGDTTANSDITEDTDTMKVHEKPNHAWVIDHLPDVLHYEALELTDDDVQSRLSRHLKSKKISYEDRVLQILVMTELFPITHLKTSDELAPVIKDIFNCYRWLYEHAELIHRDISLNNLMYRKVDGKICGVLSDYDLSLFFNKPKPGPSSKQRTGTRPYMAYDLLGPTPPKHVYRHDLESVFYVLFVLVTRYKEGKEITTNAPFQDWFDLSPTLLRQAKVTFFNEVTPPITTAFESMEPLLTGMFVIFYAGFGARVLRGMLAKNKNPKATSVDQAILDAEFNETLGGNVNFDKFQTLFNNFSVGSHPDPSTVKTLAASSQADSHQS